MKKSTLLTLGFACLLFSAAQAQGFIQLGTVMLEDQGHRLISTSDGGYITAGTAGPKAVLYKTDCLGNLVATIEKTYSPGPAVFWDVTELADGSIVAVGGATIISPTDTGGSVLLLKTNSMLVETASSSFMILNKEAQGKSITTTSTGHLLVWGEVTGVSIDFTDAFFQRVSDVTLQPTADPVIFNSGVDLARRIIPTADGNFLLTGSSFFGNIFNPDAPIVNILQAYKVNEAGTLAWQASVRDTFLAKYGVAIAAGAAQSIQSGNFVLGGRMYGGTDEKKQDAIFALISNDGTVLDTAYIDAPDQQTMFAISEDTSLPGLFAMYGESDGSPLGVPSVAAAQAYELGNDLLAFPVYLDPDNPVSIRDIKEIDPGRFALMGTFPDNPTILGATDIVIATPEAFIGIVYQNCALAATLSTGATEFQWILEDQAIPGANQGVYFPTEPGLYQVGVIDDKGCFGISDTFRVNAPIADFSFIEDNLTVTLTNASTDATEFQWLFGDGQMSNLPNPVHTYAANGTYVITLIARTQCGFADTTFQQVGVVSANEPSWLEHFSLAPNPTNSTFSVEMNGKPQTTMAFVLFNSIGQMASREELSFQSGRIQKTFDLSQLPAGVYVLQIRSGNEVKNVRVVKQ